MSTRVFQKFREQTFILTKRVGFFFLGMSLTQIFKGHDIDSEISTNKDMQRLGIQCAVQESREDTGTDCEDLGCKGNCSACDVDHSVAK